ncbi:MAG TPA: hypoxanthine-guanine phosphoribosyltransferase [Burkholderiales bacterium]|nr:hypoxanthine-guanine phosphoribosyltransferase [Burkholderiales bacterium]
MSPDQARRMLETADLVCPAATVSAAVSRLAREITARLADSFPLVLCVMRGAVIFSGQLLPQLRFPLELDYVEATRYGAATRGGEISWRMAPALAVKDRTVLVLDDILDEGLTLAAIRDKLLDMGASRVFIAVLSEKETGRAKPVAADFTGVMLPNRYVFGCGLDAKGLWRNLPDIYALKEE